MSFFTELHRRNVVRVGIAYAVIAWVLLQVADLVLEGIGAPPWVMKSLLFLTALGLLPTLVFAWVFELTPHGLKRESEIDAGASVVHQTRRKLDTLIILTLVVAVAYLFWDGRLRDRSAELAGAESTEAAGAGAGDSLAQDSADSSSGLAALHRKAAGTDGEAGTDKSIAVLPFLNLSSDPEQEYFSDGISEELLNVLAQIPSLRVAARTSSFQFKGDNRDISEIAELLKVNHVLEGSVRKAGTRLRITAQLIAAKDGYHLWSETYDRELEDIFAIQDEISLAIAEALKGQLALNEVRESPSPRATTNTPAYEAFLKGRGLINRRGNQAITAGVRELERSVRLDPNFAPARAQLAMGIALLTKSSATYGDLSLTEVNERAGEQITAAVAIDDDFAELWAARTLLAQVNGRDEAVIEYAGRALAIRSNYVDVLNWRVNALQSFGLVSEAQEARDALLEVDPLSVIGRLNAVTPIAVSEPERAMAIARSLAAQSPWASHAAQARVFRVTGKVQQRLEQLLYAYAIDDKDLSINLDIALVFSAVGLFDEAQRIDREARAQVYLSQRRFADAETLLRAAAVADADSLELRSMLASSLYYQGRYEEAVELWETTLVPTTFGSVVYANGDLTSTFQLAHALRELGRVGEADVRLDAGKALAAAWSEVLNPDHPWAQWFFGLASMLRGERDAALAHLQRAKVASHFFLTAPLDEPIFAPLDNEPAMRVLREDVANQVLEYRAAVLALVCERNPVPDYWRPLAATCAQSPEGA